VALRARHVGVLWDKWDLAGGAGNVWVTGHRHSHDSVTLDPAVRPLARVTDVLGLPGPFAAFVAERICLSRSAGHVERLA
jgi:hypothetical protein